MPKTALAILMITIFAFGSALAAVDVELAFSPDTVMAGDQVSMFSSVANMGDTETVASIEVSITFMDYEVGPLAGDLPLAAGEELSQEMAFIVPPLPVGGTLVITVSATADGVTDTATAMLTVVADAGASGFSGLDDLGDTLINQLASEPAADTSASFGALKAMFR